MRQGWEYKKWSEVLSIINGKNQKNVECPNGEFPICGSGGVMGYANDYLCPENTTIIGRKGSINKPLFITTKFWNVDTAFGLVANPSLLNPKYLYFFCCNYNFETLNKAVTIPSLTKSDLLHIGMNVPPLPTQQSIVSELDSLSKIIADCKETLKDYDALEQSIFYDMFGDPVKNEKGWDVKKLEDICSNIVDCPHSTPTKSDVPTIYPCIRTSELRNGEIYWDSMQYVEEEEYKNRIVRLQPQKDDIVFGREGSIGGAVILPEGYQFCLGQRTMLLRVDESIIHSIFLHRVILSDWVKNQIMDKNVASTVAHVNVKDVKAFLIPLPPLPLQQQFASKIEAIEKMKSETKKALQEAETLFNARMDYWFN